MLKTDQEVSQCHISILQNRIKRDTTSLSHLKTHSLNLRPKIQQSIHSMLQLNIISAITMMNDIHVERHLLSLLSLLSLCEHNCCI